MEGAITMKFGTVTHIWALIISANIQVVSRLYFKVTGLPLFKFRFFMKKASSQ